MTNQISKTAKKGQEDRSPPFFLKKYTYIQDKYFNTDTLLMPPPSPSFLPWTQHTS